MWLSGSWRPPPPSRGQMAIPLAGRVRISAAGGEKPERQKIRILPTIPSRRRTSPSTNSTIWPDALMNPRPSSPSNLPQPCAGDALASPASVAGVTLLEELEASLKTAQAFLLSRHLTSLESVTLEQRRLLQQFSVAWKQRQERQEPEPFAEAQAAVARRVLDLGRIHLVLVARSQQWLRALANLLAGSAQSYGPPDLRDEPAPRRLRPSEEQPSCRV